MSCPARRLISWRGLAAAISTVPIPVSQIAMTPARADSRSPASAISRARHQRYTLAFQLLTLQAALQSQCSAEVGY